MSPGLGMAPYLDRGTGMDLPSSLIRGLLVSRDGTLWIGTFEGLASWKGGVLAQYDELAGQDVHRLVEDHEGSVWATSVINELRRPHKPMAPTIGRSRPIPSGSSSTGVTTSSPASAGSFARSKLSKPPSGSAKSPRKLGKIGKRFLDYLANANHAANPELLRLALKLASGAGKTTVMAMIVAWQTINAVRQPGSNRFT